MKRLYILGEEEILNHLRLTPWEMSAQHVQRQENFSMSFVALFFWFAMVLFQQLCKLVKSLDDRGFDLTTRCRKILEYSDSALLATWVAEQPYLSLLPTNISAVYNTKHKDLLFIL